MTPIEIFLYGFLGSIAVEIVTVAQEYDKGNHSLPTRYSHKAFYLIRALLAVVGGGLALAYDIDKPLLAANIGAAAPLIVQALAQGRGLAPSPQPAPATALPANSNDRSNS